MRLNVNPTRMELSNLRKRLKVASRGHKLLKDKQDELMRRFIVLIKEDEKLRGEVEEELSLSMREFMMARAVMGTEMLSQATAIPSEGVPLDISIKNIMGVNVPSMDFSTADGSGKNMYPYGYAQTSGELDGAMGKLHGILPKLLRLAEKEKTCELMAREIERTRRRVNALEYVMIPQLQETIVYISMRLEENERGNLTRLMKVKEMMEENR